MTMSRRRPQRICIVGAGSVGGMLAFKLSQAGHAVVVVDVGRQLAAIKARGISYISREGVRGLLRVRAEANMAEAGTQDLVVLAVKSYDLRQATENIELLFDDGTSVLTVQNGIPWWYFYRVDGSHRDRPLSTLDEDGTLRRRIDPHRLIGGVAYVASELSEPAVVRHVEGNRFAIGELDGATTSRLSNIQDLISSTGMSCQISLDIRSEIWLKALGSVSLNPIAALTGATFSDICQIPESRELTKAIMEEAKGIAEKLGVRFRKSIEDRLRGAEGVGAHKASMLQDAEMGRPLEIEALIGAIIELSKVTGSPAPLTQAIYACAKLLSIKLDERSARLREESPNSSS